MPRPVNEHLSSISFLILLVIAVGVASVALNILESYLSSIYQQQMTFNVQTSLFDHVLRFPMSFIKSKQTGYLMSRVSDDVSMMQYLFSDAVTTIISNLFYLIFSVAILVSMNARLAALIACVIPVYIAVRYLFSDRIARLAERSGSSTPKSPGICRRPYRGSKWSSPTPWRKRGGQGRLKAPERDEDEDRPLRPHGIRQLVHERHHVRAHHRRDCSSAPSTYWPAG